MVNSDELRRKGYRHFAKWLDEAERIWNEKRGVKAQRQTLYEWLNYQGKLTAQKRQHRHLALYNAAGTNISATYLDRTSTQFPFIVDSKLYWLACDDTSEAYYLTAILNSTCVNAAIKPFQSMGRMGERDIHKKVLDLPIPRFDTENTGHTALASLGEKAHIKTREVLKHAELPKTIAQRRGVVRDALQDLLERIDETVSDLMDLDK